MSSAVFGIAIDQEYLRSLPEYSDKKEITQSDLAREALKTKNSQEKDTDVLRYVTNVDMNGSVNRACKIVYYNATGATLELVTTKDWHGHNGPSPIPLTVHNGQWAGFVHTKTSSAAAGSTGAVVYRGPGLDGKKRDWMMSWSNPFDRASWDNSVYAEVRDTDHFTQGGIWDVIYSYLSKKADIATGPDGQRCIEIPADKAGNAKMTMNTGSDTHPVVEAVFTLQDL
ncbi:hypothetical protein HYH02_004972 [Chlamydomonas schloesseri]|uniref:23 kDa jasmonate-induced protein-like n=1 Tax=Chlamydomonas schloesseri TaxID=2026947 RepID=A0A836B820_9CHLO|nr:hypothetical protein HYH02_004972 [Chlamydomonas schloesseri]|eukprot:KAG2450471.1 hypothetical protein HYH02_004972 [Chlamydomonas schloesseri]